MAKKLRNDGRYQIQVDCGVVDGKRVRKYFYGQTIAEARKKRDEWLAQRNGKSLDTVSDWADKWLDTYNTRLRESTLHNMRIDVGQIKRHFGDTKLADVTPVMVQEFINAYAGMAVGVVSRKMHTIKEVFSTAVDNRLIDSSPVRGVQPPKTKRVGGHRALTHEEQMKIVQAAGASRVGMWAMILLCTGMRVGELCALTWDDIDLDAGTISISKSSDFRGHVTEPKTASGIRTVPIMDQLRDVLVRVHTREGLVCPTKDGDRFSNPGFYKAWYKFCDEVGVMCTPHDLRDTYATFMYDAGVDTKTMQTLMGHADVQTTLQVYAKLTEQRKADSINKLRSYLTANLTATQSEGLEN